MNDRIQSNMYRLNRLKKISRSLPMVALNTGCIACLATPASLAQGYQQPAYQQDGQVQQSAVQTPPASQYPAYQQPAQYQQGQYPQQPAQQYQQYPPQYQQQQYPPQQYQQGYGQQYGQPQQYGGQGYPPQYGAYQQPQGYPPQYGGQQYQQAPASYAQAGTVIPCQLRTSISTQIANEGDLIEATISQPIPLTGYGSIPAGTVISGEVSSAEKGRRLSRSGALTLSCVGCVWGFGATIPITAHLEGGAGKYQQKKDGEFRGEGGKAKIGQGLIRGGVGAGLGAALGTGVGAIAGGGHGAGMGAWSGAAIGGGIGVADMLLRKGRDVLIPAGTAMNVQLDQPVSFDAAGTVQTPAQGVF